MLVNSEVMKKVSETEEEFVKKSVITQHKEFYIKEINKDGVTILLVEQNANKALSIANRAYVLETGKVTVSGDAKDVASNPKVREAYLG